MKKLICPFCSGTKTKPFVGHFNQDCKECDSKGFISKKKAKQYDIYDDCKQVELDQRR